LRRSFRYRRERLFPGSQRSVNYLLLIRVLGFLLLLVAGAMLACEGYTLIGDVDDERHDLALTKSFVVTAIAGLALALLGRRSGKEILRKEAIAIVGVGWLLCTAAGALPYVLCAPGLSPVSAFFESASGFTTTGSSVIADLDRFPRSILLWRATTQWLGGMGILVLFVALLSNLGVGSKSLMRHESSAQSGYGFHSRIRETALRLWQIYTGLTIVCVAGLTLLGMSLYDATLHAFAAISTGGFSSQNTSVTFYASAGIDAWLCLFMVLGGASFPLIAWLLRGGFSRVRRDEELRLYLALIASATAVVTLDLVLRSGEGFGRGLQLASFQVISIMTTTGFATADFDLWPTLSQAILVILMFVGGCSGSTSGGIKVSRVAVFFRAAGQQLLNSFRPNQHVAIRLNGERLDESHINKALFFLALTAFVVALSTLAVTVLEPSLDLVSAFTAVAATLFNIGPGLGEVGPTRTFAFLGMPAQMLLAMLMILGRLEFFGILALFLPALWRRY